MRMPTLRLSRLLGAILLYLLSSIAIAEHNTIVIGQAIDLSGPNASIGRDYVAGIKTCFDMVNSSGGINGKRIQYIVRDDGGQAGLSATAVADLIERDQADYLLGGVGDATTRAVLELPAFKRSGLVLYAPLTTADFADTPRILFWRPGYQQEIRHIFSHFSKLGISNVGIVYQDTAVNHEAYRSLHAEIAERRMKLGGVAHIGAHGEPMTQEVAQLAASKPGFILVIADTISTALFLKEYRTHDARSFVAGTSLINLDTLRELAGSAAVEWTVFSQVVPNPGAGTSLIQVEHMRMMKKYRDEAVSSMTLEGFAAAKVLIKAIQQSKRNDRHALQEFVARKGDIDLGGLSAVVRNNGNRLSNYLDIALFNRNGLAF